MPPRPTAPPALPTNIFSTPMKTRDKIGPRRRQHVRRQLSLPGLPEIADVAAAPAIRGINPHPGVGTNGDDSDGDASPDEHSAPAPAPPGPAGPANTAPAVAPVPPAPAVAPLASTELAAKASPKIATSAAIVSALPLPQTSAPPTSSSVAAVADSLPTDIATLTLPSPGPSFFPGGDSSDDDDPHHSYGPTPTTAINQAPASSTLSTSISTSTSADGRPALAPAGSGLAYNDGSVPESKTAVTAAVSIICIALFFGIVYSLFRFCPPVRSRWTAWQLRRKHERQKRMGITESPLPPPVVVVNGVGMGQQSSWATGGLGLRSVGIENGVVRPLDEAHLRPPSYRSHWTASGASWVANGFRLPERVSQRMLRLSDRSTRNRFMGNGQRSQTDSGESGGSFGAAMAADGLWRQPAMAEESRMSQSTNSARHSTVSNITSASGIRSVRSGRRSTRSSRSTMESSHGQGAFSTHARISDMSSLSAGTTTNAFRPPPLFRAPIGVARGSGRGLVA